MAGDWIKVEMTTPDKPEVVSMSAALRMDQDAVVGKLIRIWAWADQNSLAGEAMAITDAFIDRLTGKKGFASAMRSAKWLYGEDGALSFPGFDRHNGSTAKGRAMDNRKKKASRQKGQTSQKCPDAVGTKKGTREEKRREDIEIPAVSLAPSPARDELDLSLPLPEKPAPKPRNELLDALATIGGGKPEEVVEWGGAAKRLAQLQTVCPNLTVSELHRRRDNYRLHMPGATLTHHAITLHWAMCDTPPEDRQPQDRKRAGFA